MISLSRRQVLQLFMQYAFHCHVSAIMEQKFPDEYNDYARETIPDVFLKNKEIEKMPIPIQNQAHEDFYAIVYGNHKSESEKREAFGKYLDWIESLSKDTPEK